MSSTAALPTFGTSPRTATVMSANTTHCLSLSNSQSWEFTADASAAEWLGKLSGLMALCGSGPADAARVIFTVEEAQALDRTGWSVSGEVAASRPGLPTHGWISQPVSCVRLLSHPDVNDMICVLDRSPRRGHQIASMWAALVPVYRRVQAAGGLLVHACLLARDGRGVLLVAPSRTGKSTCARRVGLPWRSLCDDQVLVVETATNRCHGHPLPTWSTLYGEGRDHIWPVHEHVPIHGIFFLRQSEVTRAEPLGRGTAAALMHASAKSMTAATDCCMPDQEERRSLATRIFENSCALVGSVPSYILDVNLTTRFWEEMQRAMEGAFAGDPPRIPSEGG